MDRLFDKKLEELAHKTAVKGSENVILQTEGERAAFKMGVFVMGTKVKEQRSELIKHLEEKS